MLSDTDKAGLIYRMVATGMRAEVNPLEDMEILLLAETWVRRTDDPERAKDEVILSLVHVLSGLLLDAAGGAGIDRAEASATIERMARLMEMGPTA